MARKPAIRVLTPSNCDPATEAAIEELREVLGASTGEEAIRIALDMAKSEAPAPKHRKKK